VTPRDALRETAYEILESGLFVFLREGVDPPDGGPTYTLRVAGTHPSVIGLRADPSAARHLAGEMLGCDAATLADEEVAAATAEALNILAGAVVVRLVGADPELELLPPVAGGEPTGECLVFGTDGGSMTMWYAEGAA
jgi:hypothetical protein